MENKKETRLNLTSAFRKAGTGLLYVKRGFDIGTFFTYGLMGATILTGFVSPPFWPLLFIGQFIPGSSATIGTLSFAAAAGRQKPGREQSGDSADVKNLRQEFRTASKRFFAHQALSVGLMAVSAATFQQLSYAVIDKVFIYQTVALPTFFLSGIAGAAFGLTARKKYERMNECETAINKALKPA